MKNWEEVEREAQKTQDRFRHELEFLYQQGVIKEFDVKKIMNQVSVSKNALLETKQRNDIAPDIQEELFLSLIQDYQRSVQKIIDDAILRLGADVLITYKFNQVNEKAYSYAMQKGYSQHQLLLIESFMSGAKAYALRTLPLKTGWNKPKIDFQKMINDYAEILQDFVDKVKSGQQQKSLMLKR